MTSSLIINTAINEVLYTLLSLPNAVCSIACQVPDKKEDFFLFFKWDATSFQTDSAVAPGFICTDKPEEQKCGFELTVLPVAALWEHCSEGADSQRCRCEQIQVHWPCPGTDHALRQMQVVVHYLGKQCRGVLYSSVGTGSATGWGAEG